MPPDNLAPLRLVLFGLPGSGKSSLLGALTHASQTQQDLLGGQLTEMAGDLKMLRKQVDEGTVRPTQDEVVRYMVTYQPRDEPEQITAELVDCSGRAAKDLLVSDSDESKSETPLDHALERADGLILVVDGSASADQLDSQFDALGRFLTEFEEERGERIEVSGLPVFLVLTKCDRLVDPSDTMVSWMERIEQQKREVDARFHEMLAKREPADEETPFGQVDLYLWATATRQPPLVRPTNPPRHAEEPYGVAELFRQSLEKAEDYRDRQQRSSRRLFWTSSLSSVVVALMLSGTVGLAVLNQERQRHPLEVQLDFRFNEAPTVAGRLRLPAGLLRQKLELLKAIEADPDYQTLPEGLQKYVQSRIAEISDYLAFLDRIIKAPHPADLTSEGQLEELRKRLETEDDLKPRPEWEGTTAFGLYSVLLGDLERMQDAIRMLITWFRDYGSEAQDLATFETPGLRGTAWDEKAKRMLDRTRQIPLTDQPSLPGSQRVTPAMVLAVGEVKREHDFWLRQRQRLEGVRNLLEALGLPGPTGKLPPLLVIPPSFTLESAKSLAQQVRQVYPKAIIEFVLEGLPDDVRREVIETAQTYYESLLPPAQALVLNHLRQAAPGSTETAGRWDAVQKWLENPTELSDWRFLARLLRQLQGYPEPIDPVVSLRQFLQTPSFRIHVPEFVLEVPESFQGRIPSNASLILTHTSTDESKARLVYRLGPEGGKPARAGRTREYRLVQRQGGEISYQPGDQLLVTMELLDGEVLSWVDQRSHRYQFERLSLPPRLHRGNQPAREGTIQKRITLHWPGGTKSVPRVPDLMPQVRLE